MAELGSRPPLRLIAATALAAGLTPLNSTMLSVVLSPIGTTLGADEAALTRSLVTTYLVTSIVMQAPGGRIGDLLGHRKALTLGQLAFGLAAVAGVFASSLGWLVAARIVMAGAGALIVPSATALLRTELPASVRGRAFGIFGAVMALSAAIGPLLGGQISVMIGWRGVFAVNLLLLPISAALAGSAARPVRAQRPSSDRPNFDFVGSALLGGALAALALGVGRGGTPSLLLLAAVPMLTMAFVAVEKHHPAPVLDLSLFRRSILLASGFIIGLQNLAMYALLFELPTLCAIALKAGADRSGSLLLAVLAPMVVLSPIAGRLVDAFGARRVALAGSLMALIGMLLLLVTPFESLTVLFPGLALFGVGLGLSGAPAQSAGMTAVPAEQSGIAAGMLATLRYLGGVFGTLVLGALLVDTSDVALALAAHYKLLIVFCLALAAAVGCAFALPGRRPGTEPSVI